MTSFSTKNHVNNNPSGADAQHREKMQRYNGNQFNFDNGGGGYGADPEDDKYNIYKDPEAMFKAMSLPVPEIKSADEVRREADERRAHVIGYYITLREILKRHEATIQKRWLKKTRSQRLAILLEA